jgi:hypothetical protein
LQSSWESDPEADYDIPLGKYVKPQDSVGKRKKKDGQAQQDSLAERKRDWRDV